MKCCTPAFVFLLLVAPATVSAQTPAYPAGPSSTAVAPPSSGLVARVQEFYRKTTDFKASFRQEVRVRSPKRTFTRAGTVFFKRPDRMRWDYKTPDEVYYVSDGKVLWSYEVEEGVVWRLDLKNSELLQALRFLSGTADLDREFDATEGPRTAAGLVPLKLVPRQPTTMFQSVTLFVDPATGETRGTEVLDPIGNVSHVKFENPSFQPLPDSGFQFEPPEGVRVQELGGK